MLKNLLVLEKNCKDRLSVGGSAPNPSLATGGWRLCPQTAAFLLLPAIATFYGLFLAPNAFYYIKKNNYSKWSAFAFTEAFPPIFTSNSVVFVDDGRKNVSCPRAQGTL